jgi:hypothetical protein
LDLPRQRTVALMLAVYAIVNGNQAGWTSAQTLGLLAGAAVLLAGFVAWESRVRSPLVPLGLFRQRNLAAKLVMRFGIKLPLAAGLVLGAAGLGLFARAPVGGHFAVDVLPSMILLGFGAGIAFNPVLLAAVGDVEPTESGLASGIVNTSFMMGGALGLAVLASVAASRTSHLLASGHSHIGALKRRVPHRVSHRCPVRRGRGRPRRSSAAGERDRAGGRQHARGRQRQPAG